MTYLFIGIILTVAVLLILVIMVQNPKGGGLDSTFGGGSSQLGGVQSTNKFLDRGTWTLAIALFALVVLSNFVLPRPGGQESQINTDGVEIPATTTDETPTEGTAPATADDAGTSGDDEGGE